MTRRRIAARVTVVVSLLLATACGARPSADDAPRGERDVATGSTAKTKSSSTARQSRAASPTSPSSRKQSTGRHPNGLFRSQPAGQCGDGGSLDQPRTGPLALQRLVNAWYCFQGFEPESPTVRLVLTGKNGATRTYDLRYEGSSWSWTFTPTFDLPLGDYGFRVTQGASVLAGTAVLTRPRNPAVYAAATTQSRARAIRLELSGYPPRTAVSVFLYGPEQSDGRFPFVRPLPAAMTDGSGENVYTTSAEPDDPHGELGVWVNPTPGQCEDKLCVSFRA